MTENKVKIVKIVCLWCKGRGELKRALFDVSGSARVVCPQCDGKGYVEAKLKGKMIGKAAQR